jgi:ubiquinone/menaquinone biosynthesis C-methylase UbiE
MADKTHICPWWLGYLLASPIRRWSQKPELILTPYINAGMQVLDVGCAMGFFSLPLARMVGPTGKVICIDLQEKMIRSLMKRAAKAGLTRNIDARVCSGQTLSLEDVPEKIDFAMAFAMVHEVPDQERLFAEIFQALKPGCSFLVAEPRGHVTEEDLKQSITAAQGCGFKVVEYPQIPRSRSVLLTKN